MNRAMLILGLFACEGHPNNPPVAPVAPGGPAAPAAQDKAPTAESPRATTVATPSELLAAIQGAARTDKERARDPARHPLETLAFFGVRPESHVVELWPGGGWYTAILAPYLRERGQLAITHFDPGGDPENYDVKESKALLARLASQPAVFDKVVRQRIAPPSIALGPDASADVVLTFRNIHNWIEAGYDAQVFQAIARVLKRGGVLGVEEHRAGRELTLKEMNDTGYVTEAHVIQLAEAAGLRLEARSEINANPRDTKDHPNGVWSLPPSYAGKDVDRDKFAAIGESDRMTLRFRKP
jgi:predicted methyltransferase